jgi:hypothetical protein
MCGHRSPWEYVGQSAAVIRCKCGVALGGSEVRTMYRPDEVPLALQRYVSAPPALQEIGYVWVPPTDSFLVLGHTARWNTRRASA